MRGEGLWRPAAHLYSQPPETESANPLILTVGAGQCCIWIFQRILHFGVESSQVNFSGTRLRSQAGTQFFQRNYVLSIYTRESSFFGSFAFQPPPHTLFLYIERQLFMARTKISILSEQCTNTIEIDVTSAVYQ